MAAVYRGSKEAAQPPHEAQFATSNMNHEAMVFVPGASASQSHAAQPAPPGCWVMDDGAMYMAVDPAQDSTGWIWPQEQTWFPAAKATPDQQDLKLKLSEKFGQQARNGPGKDKASTSRHFEKSKRGRRARSHSNGASAREAAAQAREEAA